MAPVLAHAVGPGTSAAGISAALALAAFVGAGTAYELGRRRIRRRPGTERFASTSQVVAFWCGVALALVAVASPVDALGDDLFSMHMVQHLLLGLVAPLLIVLGAPVRVMTHALPRRRRIQVSRVGHRVTRRTGLRRAAVATGILAVAVHVGTFYLWHVPAAYDLAERHEVVHAVEHATMLLAGLALWWVVLGVRWQNRSGLAVLYLFLAGLPMGALAALLTLAPEPLYSAHLATTAEWGLTPLEDQQLAGAIMWVPGGLVYLATATVVFVGWLGSGPARGEERLAWRA